MKLPLVAVLVLLTGCAPIQATTAIARAEEEVRTARLANADKLAPYEYTKADLYLNMAKERQGFSDFEGAQVFAEEAERLAIQAKQAAIENLRLRERSVQPSPQTEQPR